MPPGYSGAMPAMAQYGGRVYQVGPGGTYATIGAAIQAASAGGQGSRSLVLVHPGTYVEQVGASARVDIVGATGDPRDVVIEWDPDSYSPLNTWGGPLYVAGVTARLVGGPHTGSGIYSVHHKGERVTIFEKCRFEGDATVPGSIGADLGPGSVTWLIDCVIDGTINGPGPGILNMHGWPVNDAPWRVVWLRCQVLNVKISANSNGSGRQDELWVVDCDAPAIIGDMPAGVLYTDGSVPIDPSTTAQVVTVTAPPTMPVHGLA